MFMWMISARNKYYLGSLCSYESESVHKNTGNQRALTQEVHHKIRVLNSYIFIIIMIILYLFKKNAFQKPQCILQKKSLNNVKKVNIVYL